MHRYAKAGIAVAAGAALLLGGFGTFALWNDSANLDAGTVASGQLELTGGPTAEGWYLYNGTSTDPDDYTGTALDLDDYRVQPEDELVFVAKGIGLTATGGRLFYTLDIDLGPDGVDADGFVIGTPELHTVAGGTLPTGSNATTGQYAGVAAGTPVYSVDASSGTVSGTYDVTIRVSFDASGTAGQNKTLDLGGAAVEVQQVVAD